MAEHNYYPDTLKIQIVERLLKGEPASSLREEFNITGRGTINIWKKWYLSGEFHRLKVSLGRPLEQEFSLSKILEEKEKELELIKNFFKRKVVTKENIIHFIEKHKNQLSISKSTRLFGLSRSTF